MNKTCAIAFIVTLGFSWTAAARVDPDSDLRLGVRVHSRYLVADEEPSNRFEIRRARLSLDAFPMEWLSAQLDVDVAEAPGIKDVFVRAKVLPWLSLQTGQFKKPFSRLELTSPRRLEVWERGIGNQRIVEAFDFGDRDIGLMAAMSLGPLGLTLGLFNGNGTFAEIDSGKDANLRITYRVSEALRVGTSGALQYRNAPDVNWVRKDIWAAGLDARLRLDPLEVLAEVLWAQQGRTEQGPQHLGAVLYGFLRLEIHEDLQLRPVFKLELLDDNIIRSDDMAFSGTLGINLRIAKIVRVMLQAEQVIAQSRSETVQARRFVLQLAFDHRVSMSLESR